MNKNEAQAILQRMILLASSIDFMLTPPSLEGLEDINEIMGAYDGQLLAIRASWEEFKELLVMLSDDKKAQ